MRASLVIPVRNGRETIRRCLESVADIRDAPGSQLEEIIVVDDKSTDGTPEIVREFGVTLIEGDGTGPGGARNIGWRTARSPLVWFVDADCVAAPDALENLLLILDDDEHVRVAGVGGSYDNALPESLLATLIHEEIVARHERMPARVDFLATFNVLYRRSALESAGGFDPRYRKAQDAELAYRLIESGRELRFTRASRVAHHHPTSLRAYLRTQSSQGYWRVFLHMRHPAPSSGDSYASRIDLCQPPLAAMSVPALLAIALPHGWTIPAAIVAILLLMQAPMTFAILARTRRAALLLFAPLGFVRAYARALGMSVGGVHALTRRGSFRGGARA